MIIFFIKIIIYEGLMSRIIMIILFLSNIYADSINLDQILTQKGSLRLDTSIFYANIQRQNNITAPVIIGSGIGASPIFSIPAILNTEQANQDYLNFALNLRYGLTEDIQVFAMPSFYYQHMTIKNTDFSSHNDYDFNSFNMGVLYQAKKEGRYPALLIGAIPIVINKSAFSQNQTNDIDYFKSYSFFATSFYTTDPLIFLIQGGFSFSLDRKINDYHISVGNTFSLSPMVYFSVNPYASLNFGIRYEYKMQDKINNEIVSQTGSSIAYLFGVSYEINPSLIVNIDINALNTNVYSSNGINMLFSYRIR